MKRFVPIRSVSGGPLYDEEHSLEIEWNNNCHACGEINSYFEYRAPKVGVLMPAHVKTYCWYYGLGLYDVYACSSCGHVFSHYNGDVEEYHREKYREEFGIFDKEERVQLLMNSLAAVKDFIDLDDTILEVGSGDGMLSSTIRETLGIKNINCC